MKPSRIREATEHDGAACAAIYAPYVTDTAITFELVPPTADEMSQRIAKSSQKHAWFVLEDEGRVVGYAYGGEFRQRAAYRWSCETSVYMETDRRRTGGGRQLYETMLSRLKDRGYRRAVAGMTLPNEASEGLHRALGFEWVGVQTRIGWKLGAWHDLALMQKTLVEGSDPPEEPT